MRDFIFSGRGFRCFGASKATSTEAATMLMALEILLPHSERSNLQEKRDGGMSKLDVAKHYRVPVQLVNVYLNPGYAEVMQRIYESIV